MSKHNFTMTKQVKKWATYVSPDTFYGYYEHDTLGEGGGLWFERDEGGRLELTDYDGYACLPKAVTEALVAMGVLVGPEFL